MIDVLLSVVEPKFTLFKVQVEGRLGQSVELIKPAFGERPEGLDTVDVPFTLYELIGSVINPEVFFIAHIHKTIVASPMVGVNDTLGFYFASYDTL